VGGRWLREEKNVVELDFRSNDEAKMDTSVRRMVHVFIMGRYEGREAHGAQGRIIPTIIKGTSRGILQCDRPLIVAYWNDIKFPQVSLTGCRATVGQPTTFLDSEELLLKVCKGGVEFLSCQSKPRCLSVWQIVPTSETVCFGGSHLRMLSYLNRLATQRMLGEECKKTIPCKRSTMASRVGLI
jgi:hypothetical protein